MSNQYYSPGAERAEKVNRLFTLIAHRYDLINDLQSFGLHRYWKRRLIQLAGVQRDENALDLCCGTGDLTLALARRGARTVGLDSNQEMLRVAETRAQRSELRGLSSTIGFVLGNAEQLPFADNSFDVVTVGYGLRNLTNWEVGIVEMQRVAKPAGRLLVLDFGKPYNRLWRSFYFSYLRLFVPVLGRLFCGSASAYAYILESLKDYPAQRGIEAKMREFGLTDVRIINFLGGVMSINYAVKRAT